MKIFLNIFIFMALALNWMAAFTANKSLRIPWALIIDLLLLIVLLAINSKDVLNKIVFAVKKTPARYLCYFFSWIIFSNFVLCCTSIMNPINAIYFATRLFLFAITFYILPLCIIYKYISMRKFIIFFFTMIFIAFLFGIFHYIGDKLNISFMIDIVNFFSNRKADITLDMRDIISNKTRIRGFFHEGGSFASFIFFMMPIIYSLALSKNKIYRNKYINKIIKMLSIPLMWFCLILTKSPIYLVFSLILTIVYFHHRVLKFIKKFKLQIIIFFIISSSTIINLRYSNDLRGILESSYLQRITNTIESFGDLEQLAIKEGSLSIRITIFMTQIELFKTKPIMGYGMYNEKYYMHEQFMQSSMPKTQELLDILKDNSVRTKGVAGSGGTLFSTLLVDTGIVGFILYYLFLFKTVTHINFMLKYLNNIEYNFYYGIKCTIMSLIAISFYILSLENCYITLILGLILPCQYMFYRKMKIMEKLQDDRYINNNYKL